MKKTTLLALIIVPTILLAGISYAAFTAPTALPPAGNTDSPFLMDRSDQTKSGSLSVNAFTAAHDSYFAQNLTLTGPVFSGTPAVFKKTLSFGGASNAVNVLLTGSQSVSGFFQSDTLKAATSQKPLCSDVHGTFSICTGSEGPASNDRIYVAPNMYPDPSGNGNYLVGAFVNYPVYVKMTVYIDQMPFGYIGFLDKLKGMFVAYAKPADPVIPPTTTPGGTTTAPGDGTPHSTCSSKPTTRQSLGSVEIFPNNLTSWNYITLPPGCTPNDITVRVSSVSPGFTPVENEAITF